MIKHCKTCLCEPEVVVDRPRPLYDIYREELGYEIPVQDTDDKDKGGGTP